jgi:hypothetical protein
VGPYPEYITIGGRLRLETTHPVVRLSRAFLPLYWGGGRSFHFMLTTNGLLLGKAFLEDALTPDE